MKTGLLNKRITFQANTPTANSIGEFVDTWADFVTVWAAIEPLTGRLYFEAKQANSEVEGRIRIRYRSDILPTMRIEYGTRYLRIISIVHPKEERDITEIYYKEALD